VDRGCSGLWLISYTEAGVRDAASEGWLIPLPLFIIVLRVTTGWEGEAACRRWESRYRQETAPLKVELRGVPSVSKQPCDLTRGAAP
jgi:hypothetical protein